MVYERPPTPIFHKATQLIRIELKDLKGKGSIVSPNNETPFNENVIKGKETGVSTK